MPEKHGNQKPDKEMGEAEKTTDSDVRHGAQQEVLGAQINKTKSRHMVSPIP